MHFYFGFKNSQSLVSIRLSKEQHVGKCLTTMNYSELCKIDRFVKKSKKKKTVKKNKKRKKSKKGKKVIKRKRQSRASDAGFKRALTYIFNKYGKKKAKSKKKKKK